MIALGRYNSLEIMRSTQVGLFLGDDDGAEVLLPNKYVPKGYEIGDSIEVFCYLDHQERPVATTLRPKVTRDGFAYLKVADITDFGAFMEWGLEKHLLVPFREQSVKMKKGYQYLVHCYLDDETFRLVGSTRIDRFLDNDNHDLSKGQRVALVAHRKTDLGWEVIIENKFKGLVFFSDIFREIKTGDKFDGFVKNVRPDHKIDVILHQEGVDVLEPSANSIYEKLKMSDGYLALHDKSSPELIYEAFQMSKKTFKKAIGVLYKKEKIVIKDDGIYIK
ncbi:S1-like domain-containing RNA-binding protein [Allomuricauda sp. d1]|uniref:CvfB family protein n=1 Tax=Allomuricauda sp. d1 TaxID=3136725 RepID=UPI0031D771CE